MIVHDWVRVNAHVEELDGAIAACHQHLTLIDLGPSQVVQGIVGVKSLLDLNASGCQSQGKQTAIADDAKVGSRGDGDAVVIVGRVFHGIRVEALGAELEHRSHSGQLKGFLEGQDARPASLACSGVDGRRSDHKPRLLRRAVLADLGTETPK